MSFDNAYEALSEYTDDTRWAFGTGFADPLSGVDTTVPAGVDGSCSRQYCLMLGDDALIMSHRLQQWVTNAPELEDEVALANIAPRPARPGPAAATPAPAGPTAPTGTRTLYAFFRASGEFRNVRLVETPDGDFAYSMARLLVFATWRLALLDRLTRLGRPGAGGDRGQGRQGTDLPPRLRGQVGGPAR